VTSNDLERLARIAYQAHRNTLSGDAPPWDDAEEPERKAWIAAISAVTGHSGKTVSEAVVVHTKPLVVLAGDERLSFDTDFTAGRQGKLIVNDGFASGNHARFRVVRGLWYIEDLGSTNGTSLNGLRIHTTQRLKKGDKITIGHTVVVVLSV
jgi:hypothetical protein